MGEFGAYFGGVVFLLAIVTVLVGWWLFARQGDTFEYKPNRGDYPLKTSPALGDAVEPDEAGAGNEEVAENEGDRPMLYESPMEGPPDDLKKLKGVGPKLEAQLHALGVYYFDQIAGWSDSEADWADVQIKGRGRIRRDDWVGQARALERDPS